MVVSESSASMPGEFPSSSSIPPANGSESVMRDSTSTEFEVDQTKPTTNLQIRLADGTRYVGDIQADSSIVHLCVRQDGVSDEPGSHRVGPPEFH